MRGQYAGKKTAWIAVGKAVLSVADFRAMAKRARRGTEGRGISPGVETSRVPRPGPLDPWVYNAGQQRTTEHDEVSQDSRADRPAAHRGSAPARGA
jgi:hypothetical protein